MTGEDDLVALGEVMGAHGVHGDLKVKVHNPESPLLMELESVHVSLGDTCELRAIRFVRPHGKGLRMALEGVSDREQARALYGAQLCVPRATLPAPDEDEFYLVDAIGARAVDTSGRDVGEVIAFRSYPTVDVLCVRCADGVREVPVLEPYFLGAELEGQRVVVDHLEDLEPEPERGA